MTTPSNDHLVAGFLKGDPECNRLVRSWIEATVAHIARRPSVDKDDLASASFLAAHESLARGLYRGQGLRAYIQRICLNKYLDQLRENRRTVGSDQVDIDELPTQSPSADDAARQILVSRRLRDALLKLGEKDRMAVILWNTGAKPQEIAERLETTQGAVRKRICLAIKKLRSLMEKGQKH